MSNQNRQDHISAQEIEKRFMPVLPHPDDDPEERDYLYMDEKTQRQFVVTEFFTWDDKIRFFMRESIPSSRCFEPNKEQGRSPEKYWNEPMIDAVKSMVGPNGFHFAVQKKGIDPDHIVHSLGGYGVGSIFYPSLSACAQAIAVSMKENQWYRHYREPTALESQKMEQEAQKQAANYWAGQKENLEQAMKNEHGLFKGCHTMSGALLHDELKHKILSYLNQPNQSDWLDIRGYTIVSGTTLWQAWCNFDSKAPRSGTAGFPDSETVRQSIRYSVNDYEQKVEEKLLETLNPCPSSSIRYAFDDHEQKAEEKLMETLNPGPSPFD